MKSYFVKYLPVEGEIKDGDEYLTHSGERKVANIPKKYNNPHVPYYDGYKKVQLFLCSRDIKIGDKVYPVKDKIGIANKYIIDLHNNTQTKFIKIIGTISPEATWVKEDDEFEEKEVYEKQKLDASDEIYETGVYKIKCPCCVWYF